MPSEKYCELLTYVKQLGEAVDVKAIGPYGAINDSDYDVAYRRPHIRDYRDFKTTAKALCNHWAAKICPADRIFDHLMFELGLDKTNLEDVTLTVAILLWEK